MPRGLSNQEVHVPDWRCCGRRLVDNGFEGFGRPSVKRVQQTPSSPCHTSCYRFALDSLALARLFLKDCFEDFLISTVNKIRLPDLLLDLFSLCNIQKVYGVD
ncbi:unnamed protein product [Symbiodinium natans]|uniref:Uncharacterized protein n=1 Tax=Symbiodinium natans TaxID=878477 RepID=A0A812RV88_9DINO|nr:unnamed protein product [Symbiodinium natans]